MKKLLFSLSLLCIIYAIAFTQGNYSQWNGKTWEQLDGNGKMVQLNPAITSFSIIEVDNINIKVNVEPTSKKYALGVSVDGNLKDFFRLKQVGDTLQLTMDYSGGKYPRWLSSSHILLNVSAPSLEVLVNKGNSKTEVNLQNQPSFKIVADGNPDITLTGKVKTLDLQLTGNAAVKAGKLFAEKINLSAKGNSEIEVNAKEVGEKSMEGNNDISNLFYTPQKKVASEENSNDKQVLSFSRFRIKNNSLLPAKVSLIFYRPDEKGNGTMLFTLTPLGRKSFKFPVGTKIYLANSEQVNTVMSGVKITNQTPFLIVKREDDGKSFNIK